MKQNIYILIFSLLFLAHLLLPKSKLGELFNEGVVLQQNSKVLVWSKTRER